MAIYPATKNTLALLRDYRQEFENRTSISSFDQGSKARAFIDANSTAVLETQEELGAAWRAIQLSSATGARLDAIGQSRGVPRYDFTFGYASSYEQSFMFYADTSMGATTFGGENGGADIVITTGTLLYSNANQNEFNATINYVVDADFALAAGSTIGYVSARAESAGAQMNVDRAVIRNHDFTNYVNSAAGRVKVINLNPVMNGRNRESDDNYRWRIARHYDRMLGGNDVSLHLSSLAVPGVLDTRILPGHFGIGTVGVIVLGAENATSTALVNAVQSKLDRLVAPGLDATAAAAVETSVDLSLEVSLSNTATTIDQTAAEREINMAAIDYFRSVRIGTSFDLGVLAEYIRERTQSMALIQMDSTGTRHFTTATVRRGYSGATKTASENLLTDSYSLDSDEYCAVGTITVTFV